MLNKVFGHKLTGPYLGKSQTPGGVSCSYSDIGLNDLVRVDYYGAMTASDFSVDAFFTAPLPEEWSHPVPKLGDESAGWALNSGEGIVALRIGDQVVVVTVGSNGTPKNTFSQAVAVATAAVPRLQHREAG